ncbi:MAG TPA: hypothetical protein VFP61_08300, partial [Acidimicrobiales bacterium]|nr:hypothetical protein [Acidimicrobiales bacterium]
NGSGTYGNGQYANSTSKCPSPYPQTTTYDPQDPSTASTCPASNDTNPPPSPPVPCVPTTASTACPAVFDSTTSSTTYSGTYLCTSSITFSGTVNVDTAGLYIYFVPSTPSATITLSAGVVINPTSDPAGGDPTKFALYAAGTNTVVWGGTGVAFNGTLWAPHTDVTGNGCKMTATGAMVVQSVTCNGGGGDHLNLTYDSRLQTEVQRGWRVTNYQVTGESAFSLPTCSADSCF